MKEKLQAAVKDAMRARDKVKVDTIRSILSAMQYEEMEKKLDQLSDEQALAVIQRELKKRKEEIEFAEKAKRDDLISKLQIEVKVLEEFLPNQLSAAELQKILCDLKEKALATNMGLAMKALKESHAGQYDPKMASELAKQIFG